MPWLADTHAHLDFPQFNEDLDRVLERARAAGLEFILNVGTSEASSGNVAGMSERHSLLWAAVGVHPHYASQVTRDCLDRLDELARSPRVIAIGETGLDFFRDRCPRNVQIAAFKGHLSLAANLGKPVIIHSRDAHSETLQVLRSEPIPHRKGIMHCFSGSAKEASAFLDLGFYISLAGPLTYPRAHELRLLLHEIPADRLLLETDCPYLSPQPYRSMRNEPSYIKTTYERAALALDLSLEQLAAQLRGNISRLFPEVGIES